MSDAASVHVALKGVDKVFERSGRPGDVVHAVGPLDIVRRSWKLTSGHWWKLFGLLCAFLLVMIIVMTAVGAVVGIISKLVFDPIEPMTVGALFVAVCTQLVSAVLTTALLVMLARIYVQLTAQASVSVPSSGT